MTTWAIVVGGLAALALWPLVQLARSEGQPVWVILALWIGVACSLGFLAGRVPKPQPEAEVTQRPVAVPDHGYVSSESCRACHPDEYASWHRSYHRTMTQLASADSIKAPFEGNTLSAGPVRYTLNRDGDRFWATRQEGGQSTDQEIVMVTGSHHMQFYWYEIGPDRRLGRFPYVYLIDSEQFTPADATFIRPAHAHTSDDPTPWNMNCIQCHTTHPQPRLLLEGKELRSDKVRGLDSHVAEFGISCEACHGPGAEHIAANRNPARRYSLHGKDKGDPTMVHPERLTPSRSSQICGQCHSFNVPRNTEAFRKFVTDMRSFRPGDDLEADPERVTVRIASQEPAVQEEIARDPGYMRSRFWPNGSNRVVGREYNGLLDSPCVTHGDESRMMSCLSCHQMHHRGPAAERDTWADDQLKAGMRGDAACTQCHDMPADHSHHAPDSPGNRCMNCHMPHSTYGLLKAVRSHTVSSPVVRPSAGGGEPNACNLCHLDKSLDWTAATLKEWYGTPEPTLPADEREVAAGVLWSLQGDAVQRAIVTWHMGWEPAQAASGTHWMPPFLSIALNDSYAVTRQIATRPLKAMGHDLKGFHYAGPEPHRAGFANLAMATWRQAYLRSRQPDPRLLLTPQGLDIEAVQARLAKRDNTDIFIAE